MAELVIARRDEDVSWVPHDIRPACTVYEKGGQRCEFVGACVPLPNVGREAHSFAHHIAERYDTLAPVTIFAQGWPFDHSPDFVALMRAAAQERPHYMPLAKSTIRCERGMQHSSHTQFQPEFERLSRSMLRVHCRDIPAFDFAPGALVAVSADRVRRHPKSTYEAIRDELARGGVNASAAYFMERAWALLWS